MVLRRLHVRAQSWMQNGRLQKEFLRTLILVAIFMFVGGCMVIGQMVSDQLFERYVRRVNMTESDIIMRTAGAHWLNETLLGTAPDSVGLQDTDGEYAIEPLRDILFQILPDWSRMRGWLPDALLMPLVGANFLVNVLWRPKRVMRYQGWIVLRRILVILTLLYIFRTITFIVTTVPSPLDDCRPMYLKSDKSNPSEAIQGYLVLFGRMASGKVTACTDNIYSGHTTLITVSVWCFMQYSGVLWMQIYVLMHAFLALTSILITRLHYTVDIIVAMIVASFVYVTVHYLIQFAVDDLYGANKAAEGPSAHGQIADAVQSEKALLKRINSPFLLRSVRWLDGMDLRLLEAGWQYVPEHRKTAATSISNGGASGVETE